MMQKTVYSFQDLAEGKSNEALISLIGGKGANLNKLQKFKELSVPNAFFVTTEAFRETVLTKLDEIETCLEKLVVPSPNIRNSKKFSDDLSLIASSAEEVQKIIKNCPIPTEIQQEIGQYWDEFSKGPNSTLRLAVRSSGVAEDTEFFSFAGQHDTYLNISTYESLLSAITSCFASLFTDRALGYRIKNGFMNSFLSEETRKQKDLSWFPLLCVVCQEMVNSQKSGVMFTANPINSNRRIISIDCSFGLGEALVSGLVNPDSYKVRKGTFKIVEKQIGSKDRKIVYKPEDGKKGKTAEEHVEIVEIADEQAKNAQVLSDEEIVKLAELGCFVEEKVCSGIPQDIEFGFDEQGVIHILQSRAITTLFPLPQTFPKDIHASMQELKESHAQEKLLDELKVYSRFFSPFLFNF